VPVIFLVNTLNRGQAIDDELPGPMKAFLAVLALAIGIWSTWATVIAFIGGTIPLIGIEMGGGLASGLFWLLIVDPIVTGIVMVVPSLILAAFQTALDRK